MIGAVEKWYKKEIAKTTRNFFDTHFEHKYMMKASQIAPIVAREVRNIVIAYNNHMIDEFQNKGPDLLDDTSPSAPTLINDDYNAIKKIAVDKFKDIYNTNQVSQKVGPYLNRFNSPPKIYSSGKGVVIEFKKGDITTTKVDPIKKVKGTYQTVLSDVAKNLYWDYRSVVRDAVAKIPRGHQTGGDSQGAAKNLIKSHGTTYDKGGDLRAKTGQRQTTIAVLSMAKNFKNFDRRNATAKKEYRKALAKVGDNEIFDEITTMMKNALEIKYKITSVKDLSDEEFSEYEVVKTELSDKAGNKVMEDYDVKGIKEFLEKNNVKFAKQLAQSRGIDFAEAQGSAKKKDVLRRMAMKSFIANYLNHGHSMNPNLKYKVNKQILKEAGLIQKKGSKTTKWIKTPSKSQTSKSTRKGKAAALGGGMVMTNAQKAGGRARTADTSSPAKLQNILNQILPVEVAKNMQSPALRFRTGRLANSARVVGINQGPRGGTQINYTYMRDPYETFEPGGEMGSTLRDPRRLIGGTIREIMQTKFRQRFIKTRSV
tara:strand:- start:634 stop:2253 length:1620 start_codon:yes stop_codon:yes gene_type:complete